MPLREAYLQSTYIKSNRAALYPFLPKLRESKTILDILDSMLCGIPDYRYWTRILDSNRYWDPGFLELYSRSQSLRFRIPHAKVSRILDSIRKTSQIPDIHIPLHGATCSSGSDGRMWACGAKSKRPFIFCSHFALSLQSERLKQARCFCDLLANKTVKA